MQHEDFDPQVIQELFQTSPALARLVENEDALARVMKAYETQDVRTVRDVLERMQLMPFCGVICRWMCTWECFRICRVLRVEIPEKPFEIQELRRYGEALGRLAADEKSARELFVAVEKGNTAAFQEIAKSFELQSFGHLICFWVCSIRCRRFCYLVCPPIDPPVDLDPFDEFLTAARAIGKLTADENLFAIVLKSYEAFDVEAVHGVLKQLELYPLCIIICRWLCVIHCHRVCFRICKLPRRFTPAEIRELTLRWRKLASDEGILDQLVIAYRKGDEQTINAILKEFGLKRFCFFLCHWICHLRCGLYCRIICPPSLDCKLDEPKGCAGEDVLQDLKALVVAVRGTASGGDFSHYTLEWSTNNTTWHADSFHYPPIPPGGGTQGNSPVVNGLLAYFDSTAHDAGDYFVRLTVHAKKGATKICVTSFSLFKQDVRILGAGGFTNLDKSEFDPNARFVEMFKPKCSTVGSQVEVSFAKCVSLQGAAFVGGCTDKKIKLYTLSFKKGHETNCATTGWTEFWRVEYSTIWQYRDMNMRKDTSHLTAKWVQDCVVPVPFPPFCLHSEPEARLSPSCWQTRSGGCEMSGLFTIKLDVEDTNGNHYCDIQRIWLDNKPIHAVLQIDSVAPCSDLNLSSFAIPPDCSDPWSLPLVGIAYDEYIDETLALNHRPNDNFDNYQIWVRKQGGPKIAIPINKPDGSCFYGTERVGEPGNRCQSPGGTDVLDKLADFDLRAVDKICKSSTSYAASIPASFTLERGECCVYIFHMRVWDTTKFSGGPRHVDAFWPVKICNDL